MKFLEFSFLYNFLYMLIKCAQRTGELHDKGFILFKIKNKIKLSTRLKKVVIIMFTMNSTRPFITILELRNNSFNYHNLFFELPS